MDPDLGLSKIAEENNGSGFRRKAFIFSAKSLIFDEIGNFSSGSGSVIFWRIRSQVFEK